MNFPFQARPLPGLSHLLPASAFPLGTPFWSRFTAALFLILTASTSPAQLGAWAQRLPVLIDNSNQPAFVDGAFSFQVDTENLISQGLMATNGKDIRIADSCGTLVYPHWIESDLNTDSTRIWVRLPTILAGDSLLLYLYHDNPSAVDAVDFNAVFPNTFISQGSSLTLSGIQSYDWFELRAGDTLYLSPGQLLDLRAQRIILDGIVMGDGAGHAAATTFNSPGTGPGPGQPSFNAGAGGGGYGGLGGQGGYDFADSPGAGGGAYGTRTGVDLDMGSAGASSPIRLGGAGGGAIRTRSHAIHIGGPVFCRGAEAQQPGGTQGAGGGAGGGIYIQSRRLHLSGGLFVTGGAGSVGIMPGNDDGGGGSGGRIKLFWESYFLFTGAMKATGGTGGPNGSFAGGEDGEDGSLLDTFQVFPLPYALVGASQSTPLPADPNLLPHPDPICDGQPVSFTLPTGYDQYTFSINGQLIQDSSTNTFNAGVLGTGDLVTVNTSLPGCTFLDSLEVNTVPAPVLAITASDSTPCLGDTILLNTGSGWSTILWNSGNTNPIEEATFSGNFSATVTDANGCFAQDTFAVNLGSLPFPQISINGLPACAGEPVNLTTSVPFAGYAWSNGASGPATVIFSSGNYSVTVTNTAGCQGTVTEFIQYDTLPFPQVFQNLDSLYTQIGYTSYQWYWNGNALAGANNHFYVPTFNGNYSVEVTGLNGCSGTSQASFFMVGLEDGPSTQYLSIGPNPSTGNFKLRGDWPELSAPSASVYHPDGRLLWQQNLENPGRQSEWGLNLSHFPQGPYHLIIKGKEYWEQKKIFILQ